MASPQARSLEPPRPQVPQEYKSLPVHGNEQLYFKAVTFSSASSPPALNILNVSAQTLQPEKYLHSWQVNVVPCGPESTEHTPPLVKPNREFHGELAGDYASHRLMFLAVTDKGVYFVAPPLPPGEGATFDAHPPLSCVRLPLASLVRLTIGFFFQRLSLTFSTSHLFVLLCSTKEACYDLLKCLAPVANEARCNDGTYGESKVRIDNDDKSWLTHFQEVAGSGEVRGYRVVRQQWKSGGRDVVRRVLVVMEDRLVLADESYGQDGSTASQLLPPGTPKLSIVDVDSLKNVVEVRPADEDPRQITVVFKQKNTFRRGHKWRLMCWDGREAEKVVEAVRMGVAAAKATVK